MQYQLMLAVKAKRRPGIAEIAKRLQIKQQTAVELVDRLESRHLIRRQRDRHDRRIVHVSLTAAGEALLRRMVGLSLTELRTEAPALIAVSMSSRSVGLSESLIAPLQSGAITGYDGDCLGHHRKCPGHRAGAFSFPAYFSLLG